MSLKYALHLTTPQRQVLTRIAQGRGGRRHPPLWQAVRARALLKCDTGSEGAGWTDEAVAAALDVSAGSVGRWRCQAVAEGPEAALTRQPKAPLSSRLDSAGEAQLLQRAQSAPPADQARWTLRALARELVARGIASRIRYETVRRVLKKRTDALATGAAVLSAGARGSVRGGDGKGAGPLPPALRCALSGDLQG